MRGRGGRWLATGLLLAACRDAGEGEDGLVDGPPRPSRPELQTCRFDGWAPDLLPALVLEPLGEVTIAGATAMTVATGSGVIYVGTADGRLLAIDPAQAEPTPRVLLEGDGLRVTGLAIDGAADELLFVRREQLSPSRTQVLRHVLTDRFTLDPAASLEVIRVPHALPARVGAGLVAGEGHLWVPLGDGADGEDVGPAEDPGYRPGNLLRLDVAGLTEPLMYGIPADNPYADATGAAAETWAVGLRDPAGCAVDGARARVWCADAGAFGSEANLVPAAADLGWPRFDGPTCLEEEGCDAIEQTAPAGWVRLGEDDCGVGAMALADGMDPGIDGAVVYADRCSGRVFAARPGTAPTDPIARSIVGQLEPAVSVMAADPAGGIWALDAEGRLGRMAVDRPEGTFPTRLSGSACFEDLAALAPAPDLVPYELNAPLWTDGAVKQRYIVLPPGETITIEDDGTLRFPLGAIILKTFAYALDAAAPTVVTPVETRVMIRRAYGWEFHGYVWDDAGREASLMDGAQARRLVALVGGEPTEVEHTFPSRDDCQVCHGTGDVPALGVRLDQLAREVRYADGAASQLEVLSEIGLLDRAPPEVAAMADIHDAQASREERARAYLHTNCAHCHRPGGWTPPDLTMDLRWSTPTAETELCGVPPQYGSPFPAAYRVTPGNGEGSLVWQRISERSLWSMPPLATSVVDPDAELVREWIDGMTGCP